MLHKCQSKQMVQSPAKIAGSHKTINSVTTMNIYYYEEEFVEEARKRMAHISQINYRMTNVTFRNVVQGGSSIAYLYRFGYWGIFLEAICHIKTFPCCNL